MKTGRPKKLATAKRWLTIRLTDNENLILLNDIKKSGLNKPEYVKKKLGLN